MIVQAGICTVCTYSIALYLTSFDIQNREVFLVSWFMAPIMLIAPVDPELKYQGDNGRQ